MNSIKVDVVIVGSGVAGLYTAINLDKDLDILVLSKDKINCCNSNLAQGGISTAKDESDVNSFIQDTLKAGKFKGSKSSIEILAKESIENIKELKELGVKFDTEKGKFQYTREGAHSLNRIVHHKDNTGEEVENALINILKSRKNITVFEYSNMVDLITYNNTCLGIKAFIKDKPININSKVTVLATGGIGGIFKNSTNHRSIVGDGISVAMKNNVKLKNINYIQFHPTALYEKNIRERRFLISESVRGEGGKILNTKGERFVDELLPRDIVSYRIYEEERKTKSDHVYLDVTFFEKRFLETRFPTIYNKCLEKGIDISKDLIPITPAQHYFMGGIEVDLYSQTSMENLYACGETSCTGVHGANRLASNSLLEALVFSKRAAIKINKNIKYLDYVKNNTAIVNNDLKEFQLKNKKRLLDMILKYRKDVKDELVFDR